jgi:hypothetical protein
MHDETYPDGRQNLLAEVIFSISFPDLVYRWVSGNDERGREKQFEHTPRTNDPVNSSRSASFQKIGVSNSVGRLSMVEHSQHRKVKLENIRDRPKYPSRRD